MATLVADELFSDSYLDAFYKAHVASSRSRGSLDDDIAAIEAEIRKIHQYRSRFQSFRFDHSLNSCGNSECSDEDDFEDSSPTSVFKVYNSSTVESDSPYSHQNQHKTPDVFTWAACQQVQHDHGYCREPTSPEPPQATCIDHGTISMTDILWHQLSPSKRAQAVEKLSCILQQRPSGRQSPTFSSLDLLPSSLANWIRRTGTLDLTTPPSSSRGTPAPPTRTNSYNKSLHSTKNNFEKIGNRDLKFRLNSASHQHPMVTARPITRHTATKKKPSPYSKITRHINIEVTRVRNISSCSEGEDPVIID